MTSIINYEAFSSYVRNKSICLMGSGNSLKKFKPQINKNNYEIIAGLNRIYRTDMIDRIDILFHNASMHDELRLSCHLLDIEKLNYLVFLPSIPSTYDQYYKNFNSSIPELYFDKIIFDLLEHSNQNIKYNCNLLTGISSLLYLIKASNNSSKIDLYGFDFYSQGYYGGLQQFASPHNINKNKIILDDIVSNNSNIQYFNI